MGIDDEKDDLRADLEKAFDAPELSTDAPSTDDVTEGQDDTRETDEDGQPRDERGRWTKAQQEAAEREAAAQQQQQPQEGQPQEQQQEQPLRVAPPPGWNPKAKAAFASLPKEVQEAVARREEEVNRGFQKLADYKGLDEYVEMAQSSGTTLAEALQRYTEAENALQSNFPQGVAALCGMYGIHPMQLAQELSRAYGGQMPRSSGNGQSQQAGVDPWGLLAQRLAGIEQQFASLQSERQRAEDEAISTELTDFASGPAHLYFNDVRQDMALLIRAGKADSLEDAYQMACRMNPEIHDLLISEQRSQETTKRRADQHRRASGSLPAGAPLTEAPSGSSSNSIRAALESAWADVN